VSAQSTKTLRSALLEHTTDHQELLKTIFEHADSAEVSKNALHKIYLDSLLTDSMTNTLQNIGLALRLEMLGLYQTMGNKPKTQEMLDETQRMALQVGDTNPLTQDVHVLLAQEFSAIGQFEKALKSKQEEQTISNRLLRVELGEAEEKIAEIESKQTALARQNDALKTAAAQIEKWKLPLLGLAALLLISLFILVWLTFKWKTNYKKLKLAMDERIAEMNETQKISVQYKNEGAQFKQTVETAIGKLNQLESAKKLAFKEVSAWKEESGLELAQLKDLIDQMKDNPSVTAYMSVQNNLMRLQNKNKDVLGQMAVLLQK
jgi:hypothetical protein